MVPLGAFKLVQLHCFTIVVYGQFKLLPGGPQKYNYSSEKNYIVCFIVHCSLYTNVPGKDCCVCVRVMGVAIHACYTGETFMPCLCVLQHYPPIMGSMHLLSEGRQTSRRCYCRFALHCQELLR